MNTTGKAQSAGDAWTIIVPVKALDRAKSRLSGAVSADARHALVLAMASDVVRACRDCPRVSTVRLAGSDAQARTVAAALGAEFIADPGPGGSPDAPATRETEDPLNAALAHAMSSVPGPIGVITADLPELDPRLLTHILDSAAVHAHSIVVDHRGRGTTMAFWTGATDRVCRFGVDSAERFRRLGGAVVLTAGDGPWGAAARDVDTPDDLVDLAGRRIGEATRRALRGVPVPLRGPGAPESVTMVR